MSISSTSAVLATASSSSSSEPSRRASKSAFEQMCDDAFTILAEFFSIPEAKNLELVSHNIRNGISTPEARAKFTYVHLSNLQNNDVLLAQKIVGLHKDFPKLTSLVLDVSNFTKAGLLILSVSPLLQKFVRIIFQGDARLMQNDEDEAISFLVQRINFATLEILDFSQAELLPSPSLTQVIQKLEESTVLKIFCLGFSRLLGPQDIEQLLEKLPVTLEELGPFIGGPITDGAIHRLMHRNGNSQNLKKCNLDLSNVSSEKLGELLAYFPLSQMSNIRLEGRCMNVNNLNFLASKLLQNFNLVELYISGADVSVDNIIDLLKSIASPNLEKINIDLLNHELETEEIKAFLKQSLPSFPKLRQFWFEIDEINLDLLRAGPPLVAP